MLSQTCPDTPYPNKIQKVDAHSNIGVVAKLIISSNSICTNNIHKINKSCLSPQTSTHLHPYIVLLSKKKGWNLTQSSFESNVNDRSPLSQIYTVLAMINNEINTVRGCKIIDILPTEVINSIYYFAHEASTKSGLDKTGDTFKTWNKNAVKSHLI